MKGISHLIKWRKKRLISGAASSQSLLIGYYGEGQPSVTIIAGVHGDEGPWGAWAISKFLEKIQPDQLEGSIKIVPQSNPSAMEFNSRVSPMDHLDLNRVFPGDNKGSYTERLAYLITDAVIGDADIVIDLHGGGSWCVNAFAFQFPGSESLALNFNPPFVLDAPMKKGTLTRYASSIGARVTAVEMGGRCDEENAWAEYIASGLERCLVDAGVVTKSIPSIKQKTIHVGSSKVIRSSRGGLFMPQIGSSSVGKIVPKGTFLGRLVDPVSLDILEVFEAPFDDSALLLLRPRMAVLEIGAMTYVISKPI